MEPARDRFALSASLFLRLLAVIHATAFLSLWVQLPGLLGPHGLLPAADYLRAAREQLGPSAWLQLPTLCWFFGAGRFLPVLCAVGVACSALLFAGVAPTLCLAVLWAAYLSLVSVGQAFLGFQWDALLLETTFLALFLAPRALLPRWRLIEPPRVGRFLLTWLLFRLMFLSGVVKLSSGDPTWRNLTALTFHYETQPLPNPLAWSAHHLPAGFQRASCLATFFIELVVPFFLFAPRPFRHSAALLTLLLQLGIALTGNFAFFNLLTIALALLCLDDAVWPRLRPRRASHPPAVAPTAAPPFRLRSPAALAATAIVLYTTLLALHAGGAFIPIAVRVAPFATFNNYGLFAVMTTSRPELIIEGSNDRRTWLAYELPYKPGDPARRPPVVAPHQPRLDWQLWFAALGSVNDNPWIMSLAEHLLRGTPEVLALFARNPFPDHPPRFLRIVRYDYHFTTPAERARSGRWWRRTPVDLYLEPASLP